MFQHRPGQGLDVIRPHKITPGNGGIGPRAKQQRLHRARTRANGNALHRAGAAHHVNRVSRNFLPHGNL